MKDVEILAMLSRDTLKYMRYRKDELPWYAAHWPLLSNFVNLYRGFVNIIRMFRNASYEYPYERGFVTRFEDVPQRIFCLNSLTKRIKIRWASVLYFCRVDEMRALEFRIVENEVF